VDWRLDGHVLIACNCDYGCPCNFNALPSRGKCEGGWIWSIEKGHLGDVEVGGLKLALYANWPKAIHDGGGRAICYLDERADARQREVLTDLLHGKTGGPWAIFINTYALSGPEIAGFDFQLNGYDTRVTIGESVELQLATIRNPVTHHEVHPEVVLPEGLITKHSHLGASKVFHVRELELDHSGQYAAFGTFSYKS
jgi:hypothetical protein